MMIMRPPQQRHRRGNTRGSAAAAVVDVSGCFARDGTAISTTDAIDLALHYFHDVNIRRIAVNARFEREEVHEFYEKLGYTRNGFRFVKELPMPAD